MMNDDVRDNLGSPVFPNCEFQLRVAAKAQEEILKAFPFKQRSAANDFVGAA